MKRNVASNLMHDLSLFNISENHTSRKCPNKSFSRAANEPQMLKLIAWKMTVWISLDIPRRNKNNTTFGRAKVQCPPYTFLPLCYGAHFSRACWGEYLSFPSFGSLLFLLTKRSICEILRKTWQVHFLKNFWIFRFFLFSSRLSLPFDRWNCSGILGSLSRRM